MQVKFTGRAYLLIDSYAYPGEGESQLFCGTRKEAEEYCEQYNKRWESKLVVTKSFPIYEPIPMVEC